MTLIVVVAAVVLIIVYAQGKEETKLLTLEKPATKPEVKPAQTKPEVKPAQTKKKKKRAKWVPLNGEGK